MGNIRVRGRLNRHNRGHFDHFRRNGRNRLRGVRLNRGNRVCDYRRSRIIWRRGRRVDLCWWEKPRNWWQWSLSKCWHIRWGLQGYQGNNGRCGRSGDSNLLVSYSLGFSSFLGSFNWARRLAIGGNDIPSHRGGRYGRIRLYWRIPKLRCG